MRRYRRIVETTVFFVVNGLWTWRQIDIHCETRFAKIGSAIAATLRAEFGAAVATIRDWRVSVERVRLA